MTNTHIRNTLKFLKDDWHLLKQKPLMMGVILVLLPLIYLFVYMTGGIRFVYSHTMYIPIILAGIFYGATFGGAIAFIASILLGPLMPLNTTTMEMQDPLNWLYRMILFLVIGILTGYTSNKLRQEAKIIEDLMSVNQETNIPNTNYLSKVCTLRQHPSYALFTILLNNDHNIIDILGLKIYHELIYQIYQDLLEGLPKDTIIVQSDSNKLWVITPHHHLEDDVRLLLDILKRPRQVQSIPLFVDYSVGGSVATDINQSINLWSFENSDVSARQAQVNNLVYVLENKNKYLKRSEYDLLASFAQALINNETFLVFQPKINLKTLKPYGFEALIRWEHPLRGNIFPRDFIPLIEGTKLIHLLTDWVITHSLKVNKKLMDLGYHLPISINISAKNLLDPLFYERTLEIINESNVPFELIEFEITESALMVNPEESQKTLEKFTKHGIKISIDDFGSGYSSLAYLTKFPLHYIKIDRIFMQDILTTPAMSSIVQSTVSLSKTLGYKIVIEGVETKEILDLVQSFGSDCAQGYFFAKPMISKDLIAWLKKHH